MQTKIIDTKFKEIYYTSVAVEDNEDSIRQCFVFWNAMNATAMQNMVIVNSLR